VVVVVVLLGASDRLRLAFWFGQPLKEGGRKKDGRRRKKFLQTGKI